MTELLTAAQMRAIEQAAIASGEVTGLELMERAGRGVVEAIFEEWPELAQTSYRAVVLCGPGNNGGDGFVVARLLKEWGWEVEVFLYGEPAKLPPDAKVNYERWMGLGEVNSWDDVAIEDRLDDFVRGDLASFEHHLVVDALFGTGLTRSMPDDTERTWHGFVPNVTHNEPSERPKYVAVDMPSGLCSDSGKDLDGAFPTDLTVTFHRAKVGLFLSNGPMVTGKVLVKPIWDERTRELHTGLEINGRSLPMPIHWDEITLIVTPHEVMRAKLMRDSEDHKYTHGHALILSGGAGRGGAARLAARGALRIGAGLVTVACPPEALVENAARLDAVMLKPIADADAFGRLLEDKRISALCLGPGLGTGEREVALVAAALGCRAEARPTKAVDAAGRASARHGRSLVLDADALTILAREPDLFAALHENCVLTPHAGEFARLFPDIEEKLAAPAAKGPAYSKVDATREAAKRAGCVVLYKGPDTVIADPEGRCSINSAHYDRAAPWLATAGSGDVLAGFIAGLLARGFAPMQAAETAAWLHVECALKFGPGLIAEDLPDQLPAVFRDLGL